MAKEDGIRTVVIGGKNDVQQQYCGVVGGQSADFTTIDTEIKVSVSVGLQLRYRSHRKNLLTSVDAS
jgi:hypothetical protein